MDRQEFRNDIESRIRREQRSSFNWLLGSVLSAGISYEEVLHILDNLHTHHPASTSSYLLGTGALVISLISNHTSSEYSQMAAAYEGALTLDELSRANQEQQQ
ncbi:MAG TPA: hypothetical protein VL989_01955 [Candidatus Sulfotelmatobacter sp.]|nr:hypothetical protein [Candidatus Sulfotelmatobacter sp.]